MNNEDNNVNNINVNNSVNNQISLDEQLMKLQDKWTDNIKELNSKMKNINSLNDLLNDVYSKRQDALDLYYGTMKVLAARTRDYKIKASNIYNTLKSGQAGLRYTNESAINTQIESSLNSEKETIDLLTNFTNYIKDTIQTIDNIIYGINTKIKIYEMLNGLKF
jgi:hypothetical protein